jgi:hypothetical protein
LRVQRYGDFLNYVQKKGYFFLYAPK